MLRKFLVPTLNFVLGIFRWALLKSGSLFYIDYVKKTKLKKKNFFLPTHPIFIWHTTGNTTIFFLWPDYI